MEQYTACQQAYDMLAQAKEEMRQGGMPSVEEMAEIVHMHEFCNIVRMQDFWADQRQMYYPDEKKTEPPTTAVASTASAHALTHDQLKAWVSGMYNGTMRGAKWAMDATTKVGKDMGIMFDRIDEYDWWTAMNMMYSDVQAVAELFNVDVAKFYASLAKAFLFDDDTKSPKENLYYKWCSKK